MKLYTVVYVKSLWNSFREDMDGVEDLTRTEIISMWLFAMIWIMLIVVYLGTLMSLPLMMLTDSAVLGYSLTWVCLEVLNNLYKMDNKEEKSND